MDRNKRVSTFAQKSAYETALDQARQQQALAEALAQQQYRPLEGGAAPTPSFAPLVMALQGYLGGRAARKAREAEAEAKGMETVAGRQIAGRVFGGAPVSDANTTPDASGLAEVAIQSQYRASPQDALRMASTPQGVAALKGNPALAAALEQSMRQPETAEFGTTPQYDEQGRAFVVNKAGNVRFLDGVKAPAKAPEAVTPTTVMRNGKRVVIDARTGKEIGEAPESQPLVVNYGSPVAGVDEQGNPVYFQPSRTGGKPSIVPGVRPEAARPTEGQVNSALFVDRMSAASPVLDKLQPPSVTATTKAGIPGIGNVLLSPENRQFFQAERNFITAVLRKESGASISDQEFATARQVYIPQPGDDDQTLKMKREARASAISGIARGAGSTYQAPRTPAATQNEQVIVLPPRR
jgi:hypothetical protein